MLDHVSIGVRDLKVAKRFYDATLEPLGYSCLQKFDGALGYGGKAAQFWVLAVQSPVPAKENSGLHFSFSAPSRESVAASYDAALKAGGRDNGKPGLRADYGPGYYAAFVVDPDGYRIEVHCDSAAD